jgi:Pyruvate/2-oxoacid:ferredoxin oxidoreductase delta subunit/flavodoxin
MYNFDNIKIFYFSGTGNAKRIALWLSEFSNARSLDCKLINIAKIDFKNLERIEPEDLIIIISPIHGFNYPKIVLEFIRHFPKGKNNVLLMNTRAGMRIGRFVTPGLTGVAFILSSLILKIKGYHIQAQIPFDMPSNWISIHPALNQATVKYLHKVNYERVEKHAHKIFSGQRDFLAYRDLVQDVLIIPVSIAYYCLGRFVIAKSFYASADCDNCGLCLKHCPVQAIKMLNKKPYWTFKCESCMSCMNNCPKHAIETAHGLIAAVSILSSTIFTFLMQNVVNLDIESSFIRLLIWTAVFMMVMTVLYYLQHLLLKVKLLSKIISITSLTYYRFWGRYKSISDKQWRE